MDALTRKREWLLYAAFLLFLLAMVLTPFAVERTYAGREETPSHILTYTTGRLVWDSSTNVDEKTGVAELSLFDSVYENVQAENGDRVIAPGTEEQNIVRLKNDSDHPITYIAVMYRMKDEDTLPVAPVMADDAAFTDTATYPLPENVTQKQVVRAVTGTVGANERQDFDITWQWEYYESDERDQMDTALGNKAAWATADEVKAGIYIVVAQDDSYTSPEIPGTGDHHPVLLVFALMAMSITLLLILVLERRKGRQ